MAYHRIDPSDWPAFFDTFARALVGKRATIKVAALDLGDQIVAERLPLLGITYDRKSDVVMIALEGVDHMIRAPREMHAECGAGVLIALEIIDAEERHQIVKLADPVALPAPAPTSGAHNA